MTPIPRAWWRRRRRKLLRLLAVGVAVSIATTVLSATGYFEASQAKALDLLFQLRGRTLVSDVVIVAIDEAAFASVGRVQPLSRDYLARVVRGAQRAGAAVVALDIALETPEAGDAALAEAIAAFSDSGGSRVVITADPPAPGPLADVLARVPVPRGVVEIPEDSDGTVRRAAFVRSGPEAARPSLALAAAARLTGTAPRELAQRWTLRPEGLVHINFAGPAGTFLTIPSNVVAALAADGAEAPRDNPLRDRVVLVGGTFPESRDFLLTPHGRLAGVEVHANAVHMLLTGGFIRPAGWLVGLAIQTLAVAALAIVMVSTSTVTSAIIGLVVPLVVALPVSYLAFHSGGYWVDFVLPVFATRVLGGIVLRLERRRIQQAFSHYVSKEIAAEVLADAPSLRGERRDVSILFSDLRGFTTLSETREPAEIATHLNEYFEVMTAAIFRHRGMVNDFVGDAVMGIFGAPLDDPEHARHAVAAAAEMVQGLETLNAQWECDGKPTLQMGIGVHSGRVFAGNVGGRTRFKYTIVGDAVNLASRVEGINKELGTTVLITEATLALVGHDAPVRDCGLIPVKGRNEPVHVFELLRAEEESSC